MELQLTKDQADVLRFYLVDCICDAKSIGAMQYAEQLETIYEQVCDKLKIEQAKEVNMANIPW